MRTAFVTGIAGQTGSYLAEELLADGWTVHGLVRAYDGEASEFQERTPDAVLHLGDLADDARLHELVAELEPDASFNLGGISSVAQSWQEPALVGRVCGVAVLSLLDAAWSLRERSGRRVSFVQASSAEMFGYAEQVPQNENTPLRPASPYGAAKTYAHQAVGVYRRLGLEASSSILYNHETPRRPLTFVTRKITDGVARIAAGLAETVVLGNLEARRDWGWAPDYAKAIALAADGEPNDYVIATGVAHSVADFVEAAFAAAGIHDWHARVEQDERFLRPQDSPVLVGDATRARERLGWSPTKSFDRIVAEMVQHDRTRVTNDGVDLDLP
jgi:GDPmannose 4,6-dehydratase